VNEGGVQLVLWLRTCGSGHVGADSAARLCAWIRTCRDIEL